MIDTITIDPVLYLVSACESSGTIKWFLNAIDVTSGAELMSGTVGGAGGVQIEATGFNPANQLQRPALLVTHVEDGSGHLQTYLYISFGTAVYEVGSGSAGFNGYVFGYQMTYASGLPSSVSASALAGPPFVTTPSNTLTGVYPGVSQAAIGSGSAATGPYTNPSCGIGDAHPQICYHGDNWTDLTNGTGHGGGVWMAGKGPSSDGGGNVYFGAGNGTFDCSTTGSSCTISSMSSTQNFGDSAVELTAASVTPADFFTPYTPNFLNDLNGTFPTGHSATATKVQALSRYALDFGTAGVLLFATSLGSGTQTWAVTSDKTGYVYSMPTLISGTGSTGLGQFQSGDAGLTSGSFTTQAPFQLSRKPPLTGTSTTTCPYPTSTDATHFSGGDCDQIMELAYWNHSTNQYLFAWPEMETLIAAKGSGTLGSPTNYTFSSTLIDPCGGLVYCANFPQAAYPGGNMAVAADSTASATLWVSFINNATATGELRGYSINPGGSSFFTKIYDPTIQATNAGNCTGLPSLPASFIPSSFAEPTVVNGMVFAPVFKAKTSTGAMFGPGGVLVYGNCP